MVCEQVTAPCRQHAPSGQGLGVQDGKLPNQPEGQLTVPPKVLHAPVLRLQHVTIGGKQGLGLQMLPMPIHWPVQSVWACTMVQMIWPAALVVQHAPHVGMQIAGGRQVPPAV